MATARAANPRPDTGSRSSSSPAIHAPTLLIVGDNCPAIRKQQLAEMANTLPRGKLVNLEGYDYGIHFLAPERCVEAVRQFLGFYRPEKEFVGWSPANS